MGRRPKAWRRMAAGRGSKRGARADGTGGERPMGEDPGQAGGQAGRRTGLSRAAKEAGIAAAVIAGIAGICAAGLTSGAYKEICPSVVCRLAASEARPSATASVEHGPPSAPPATSAAPGGAPTAGPDPLPPGVDRPVQGIGPVRTRPPVRTGGSLVVTDPPRPPEAAGDFTVGLSELMGCYLRSGQDGAWDVNVWLTVGWSGTGGRAMPPNGVRLVTDVGRAKDWRFTTLGNGSTLDTFVDSDDRYLGRELRITATVDPDRAVRETAETNNSATILVDLRGGLPLPNTNRQVACRTVAGP